MGIFDRFKKEKEKAKYEISDEVLDTIDPSIVPMIKTCNKEGVATIACCSGDRSEHEGYSFVGDAYIMLLNNEKGRELIANLLDNKEVLVRMSSAFEEPISVYPGGPLVDTETFAFYFQNESGQNMQKMYVNVQDCLKRKPSRKNLRTVENTIKKIREVQKNLRVAVEYNNIDEAVKGRNSIEIYDIPIYTDEKNCGNLELFLEDSKKVLAHFGDTLCLPENSKRGDTLKVLDYLNRLALRNKNRYTISRSEIRKQYEEAPSQEYEYLGEGKIDHKQFIHVDEMQVGRSSNEEERTVDQKVPSEDDIFV